MKVLHLNQFGARAGGAEGYIAEVSAALKEKGHISHLVYFSDQNSGDLLPASTHVPLEGRPASTLQATRAMETVIDQFQPDVAFLHVVYPPELVDWVARRLPTIAYVHAPYPVCPGSALFLRRSERPCNHRPGLICYWNAQAERCCWGHNPLLHLQSLRRVHSYRQAYRPVRRVLVGSAYMQRLLIRAGFSNPVSILAPVLLHDDWFVDIVEPDPYQILFAGRLVQEKGLAHLLKALSMVEMPWRLVVAGDGPARSECRALADQLRIADQIVFRGWLNLGEMKSALQRSACIVVPSLWPEPFGRMGAEAFVYGRPIVAYAAGGVVDWLEHQVTGLLVAPGDIRGLACSIQQMLQEPESRQQMGQRAREYAWRCWRRPEHVDQLVNYFLA